MPAKKEAFSNRISLFDYDLDRYKEEEIKEINECVPYKDTQTVTWINVDQVPPAHFLEELGLGFEIHPIVLGDIVNVNQRPKIEILDDYIYVVLKMLHWDDDDQKTYTEQVSLIIASKFLISFQQGVKGDVFETVRKSIRKGGRIRGGGTDYLAYKLLDSVVDAYFRILEKIGEKIENLEEILIRNPSTKNLHHLNALKKQTLELRKNVWPLREVIGVLERGDSRIVKKGTRIFLRDVYEHTVQVIDGMETDRDLLSGLFDIYLSSTSNRMNAIIKVLTIITTIFMPLTFLSGLYGMNFAHLPGNESRWGFWIMVSAMTLISLSMLAYFRKKKWL